jgi:hypothetical protein
MDPEKAKDLIFDPFETIIDENENDDPNDPDMNYYRSHNKNAINSCKYYTIDEINRLNSKNDREKKFKMFHLNIRSMAKNYTMFQNTLAITDTKYDVIILSETWLKPYNVDIYKLEGYTHEFITRKDKAGGGLSIYVKDSIQYNVLPELNINSPDIEMIWLEIKKDNLYFDKNLIIGGMYRRPGSNPNDFIDLLNDKLLHIKQTNKHCIYAGDFNLDLLKHQNHPPTNEFININLALSYIPQINRPTRITKDTATIIDNFFSNFPITNEATNGIMLTDLSDHFPIFTEISKIGHLKSDIHTKKRKFNDRSI